MKKSSEREVAARLEQVIGKRLRDLRRKRKWPIKRVAFDLGVSVSTVSDWERGRRFPSGRHLLDLSDLYETPMCQLMCSGLEKCPFGCRANAKMARIKAAA